MVHTYMPIFISNSKLNKSIRVLMEQGGCPYLVTLYLLDNEDNHKYQYLIGSLKWDIYLGRFGICTEVIKNPSFIPAPRQGHMDFLKRIYEYPKKGIPAFGYGKRILINQH